jgi:hypothetical protein
MIRRKRFTVFNVLEDEHSTDWIVIQLLVEPPSSTTRGVTVMAAWGKGTVEAYGLSGSGKARSGSTTHFIQFSSSCAVQSLAKVFMAVKMG